MTRETFEIEIRRLRPVLLGYVHSFLKNHQESEDVVQETLLKLWVIKDKIDVSISFDGLAYTISRRLVINILKRKRRFIFFSPSINLPELPDNSEEGYSDDMINALESLPTVEQAVMRMKHIERMETDEIAALIGSTPGAIRVALSRARKKLREKLLSGK